MDVNRLPDDGGAGAGTGGSGALEPDSDVLCSVCLEPASKRGERTVVKLKCKHKFHLDCIGSAFNAKQEMECPTCRYHEIGEWLFGAGSAPSVDEDDDETNSQNYGSPVSNVQWCPYAQLGGIPVHLNEGNYLINYTHSSLLHSVQPEVQIRAPAYAFQGSRSQYHGLPFTAWAIGGHIIGAEQNSTSASAHPFPAQPSSNVSPYHLSLQHGVLPSLQPPYYQHNSTLPQPQGHSEQQGPLTSNSFPPHFSSLNLRLGFVRLPATQGSRSGLNSLTQWAGQRNQT